jgi:methionyl-tRNA formyltransferase
MAQLMWALSYTRQNPRRTAVTHTRTPVIVYNEPMSSHLSPIPFAFMGTPDIAVGILNELKEAGLMPAFVVTNEDKPKGRNLTVTPPPVKVWALEHSVPVFQPATLKTEAAQAELRALSTHHGVTVFIVAAYGKILPKAVLDIPQHGCLNVHGSILPKFRGASPIQAAILADERETASEQGEIVRETFW